MTSTLFFRHLADDDKAAALRAAVAGVRDGAPTTASVFAVDPASFRQVPGSPFAYWVSERIRRLFVDHHGFETWERHAQSGATTSNDFRYLRSWWESQPSQTGRDRDATRHGRRWVPLSKGGQYSPFYSDLDLMVDWNKDGQELKSEIAEARGRRGWGYHWTAALNGHDYYFRPGLTWPPRTQRGFNMRAFPQGSIFAGKGPSVFVRGDTENDLALLLAVTNSSPFKHALDIQMAFGSFEVGVVQRTPVPSLSGSLAYPLISLALSAVNTKRSLDTANEISHAFILPALLQVPGATIAECVAAWGQRVREAEAELARNQAEIDEIAFRLYGIEGEDRAAIEAALGAGNGDVGVDGERGDDEDDEEGAAANVDAAELAGELLSWALGCAFGRWDVRLALDPSLAPRLQGPFEPLPVCSPAMLVGPDGLPARRNGIAGEAWLRARPDAITPPPEGSVPEPVIRDEEYPLRVDWDGIIVDDEGHPDDIVARVREVLALVFGGVAAGERAEAELCAALGVRELREELRNPRRFWDAHVQRYSKSRRKAPIYWLLQSAKRGYAIWLAYHRMDEDILFKALRNYVDPKITREENRLEELTSRLPAAQAAGGRARRDLERAIERQQALIDELKSFRMTLEEVALLGLTVDHDDGVLLSIAPLHALVPWRPAAQAWGELVAGKYGWSTMAQRMAARGLVRDGVEGGNRGRRQ